MKRLAVSSVIVCMVIVAVLLFAKNRQTNFSDCVLANVEALTNEEDDEVKGSRPKVILSCFIKRSRNNQTYDEFNCCVNESCEDYTVVPPMVKESCSTSSCPSGTFCKYRTPQTYTN